MTCGIYMIKNKKTGQIYIGQSSNIEYRWKKHLRDGKYRNNSYIDNAINKYGKDIFQLIIIEILPNNADLLNKREMYWIDYYNTYKDKKHYNLTLGGDLNPMKHPEIAKKLSGKGNGMYGVRLFGNKNGFYGKKHTKKTKELMSKRMRGKNNPNYGKHRSEEVKKKISEANKGKTYSKETLEKMKKGAIGAHNGHKNGRAKYFLWDINKVHYEKNAMYRDNRVLSPCKCFKVKYNANKLSIGGFIDFVTCELINDLIKRGDI